MTHPISIDIISDVVCPWCYLGKRRLEHALADRSDVNATVRWHPFFLDPGVPAGGIPRIQYITRKFGGDQKITPMHKRLIGLGEQAGIDFHFERIETQPNTTDAHRVINWAQEQGNAGPVVDRLFSLFFTEGADLTDPEVLVEAGRAGGLEEDALRRDLAGDRDAELITRQAEAAAQAGIGGVPFFIFDRKLAVAGAQEPEVFGAAITQAMSAE